MAPGTRTPNGRMMSGIYAGLPRNLNTELAAKTGARPAAVFCLETTAKLRPNTKPKSDEARHITPAFAAGLERGGKSVRQHALVKFRSLQGETITIHGAAPLGDLFPLLKPIQRQRLHHKGEKRYLCWDR